MSNDGFRCVIELRGGSYYWEITCGGEQYKSSRGYQSILEAADVADVQRRAIGNAAYFKAKKQARAAS
jgi:hypothetical protein